jgi:endonuclease YncB( thermonuclease family)
MIISYYYPYLTGEVANNSNPSREIAFIQKVIDGDTIKTNIGTVRLLGINTPEKNMMFYNEAKFFLKEFENSYVELERDRTDVDRYNRKLRYVFYNERLINIEILEKGLATTFMIDDLKYKNKLVDAEKFAKNNNFGLFQKSSDICSKCIKLLTLDFKNEFFIIKNDCIYFCNLSFWTVKDDANHIFKLNSLDSNEEERYSSENDIWNNDGDRFFLRDKFGKLVIFYEY